VPTHLVHYAIINNKQLTTIALRYGERYYYTVWEYT
jgi:hypothetical protein